MNLRICPLRGGLGAEIIGYDFDRPPDRGDVQFLRNALIERHLLLFRGRTLDPARQVAFTLLFGDVLQTCSPRLRYIAEFPQIFRVSNRKEHGHLNIGRYWHSDGAYIEEPTAVTIHHIVVPTGDGDTLYTGLANAYERLAPAARASVSGMKTRAQTGVVHPLVKPHPVTGRIGLYVNLDPAAIIIDGNGQENGDMREFIGLHLSREGTFYRHRWREGDMVVVDNFAVAHHATEVASAALRVLHRTSIHGPSVWWRTGHAAQVADGPAPGLSFLPVRLGGHD